MQKVALWSVVLLVVVCSGAWARMLEVRSSGGEVVLSFTDAKLLPGQIPLVLVHGKGGSSDSMLNWYAAIKTRFTNEFKVYRLDYQGAGTWGPQHTAPMIEEVMAKAKIRGAIVLAHSMGGLEMRQWIVYAGGAKRLRLLITLGTPHHGSPLAVTEWAQISLKQSLPILGGFVLDYLGPYNPEKRALVWDNYDEAMPDIFMADYAIGWIPRLQDSLTMSQKMRLNGLRSGAVGPDEAASWSDIIGPAKRALPYGAVNSWLTSLNAADKNWGRYVLIAATKNYQIGAAEQSLLRFRLAKAQWQGYQKEGRFLDPHSLLDAGGSLMANMICKYGKTYMRNDGLVPLESAVAYGKEPRSFKLFEGLDHQDIMEPQKQPELLEYVCKVLSEEANRPDFENKPLSRLVVSVSGEKGNKDHMLYFFADAFTRSLLHVRLMEKRAVMAGRLRFSPNGKQLLYRQYFKQDDMGYVVLASVKKKGGERRIATCHKDMLVGFEFSSEVEMVFGYVNVSSIMLFNGYLRKHFPRVSWFGTLGLKDGQAKEWGEYRSDGLLFRYFDYSRQLQRISYLMDGEGGSREIYKNRANGFIMMNDQFPTAQIATTQDGRYGSYHGGFGCDCLVYDWIDRCGRIFQLPQDTLEVREMRWLGNDRLLVLLRSRSGEFRIESFKVCTQQPDVRVDYAGLVWKAERGADVCAYSFDCWQAP